VSVRAALPGDADAIFRLIGGLVDSETPDRAGFDRTFASFVGEGVQPLTLVAEVGGVVVGYALVSITPLLYTNGASAQLQELVVDSAAQNVGIGSALVEAIEGVCRERGAGQLTVPSRRSAGFYERLGYRSTADYLKRTFD
jgi:GNAT superfamily N-acetyltransferase